MIQNPIIPGIHPLTIAFGLIAAVAALSGLIAMLIKIGQRSGADSAMVVALKESLNEIKQSMQDQVNELRDNLGQQSLLLVRATTALDAMDRRVTRLEDRRRE